MSYLLAIAGFIALVGGFALEVISNYWGLIVAAWIVIPVAYVGFLKMYDKPDLQKAVERDPRRRGFIRAFFLGETWL